MRHCLPNDFDKPTTLARQAGAGVHNRHHLFFVVIVVCGLFATFRKNYLGEDYQGRRLAEWVEDLSFCSREKTAELTAGSDTERYEAAVKAIHHFGTNALPLALRLCRTENSALELKLMTWCDDLNSRQGKYHLDHGISYAQKKWEDGLNVFQVLGSNAAPAIPTLIGYLYRDNSAAANNASAAFYHIGPTAIPELLVVLTNQNKSAASLAAFCLGQYGSNSVVATNLLLKCLEDADASLRDSAAHSLARISDDPVTLVPSFVRYLQQKKGRPHPDVFMKLRSFGSQASTAVPVLIEIMNSPGNLLVSRNALLALEQIDPTNASSYRAQFAAKRLPIVITNYEELLNIPDPPRKQLTPPSPVPSVEPEHSTTNHVITLGPWRLPRWAPKPDFTPDQLKEWMEKFLRGTNAYQTLSDPQRVKVYRLKEIKDMMTARNNVAEYTARRGPSSASLKVAKQLGEKLTDTSSYDWRLSQEFATPNFKYRLQFIRETNVVDVVVAPDDFILRVFSAGRRTQEINYQPAAAEIAKLIKKL